MRENTAPGITHPEWINGRRLWMDPGIKDMIHKLHYGDPTMGWEGDPRLALYLEEDRWVVQRLESDGVMRVVMQSQPGGKLDDGLILHLMAHDARRGFDPVQFVSG